MYNKSLINKLIELIIVVKNMIIATNSEDEKKYLQYLIRKYAGKHETDITNLKDGGTNNE